MPRVRLDALSVQTFKERVVIDLEEDAVATDDFIVLSEEGGTIHLGVERRELTWAAMQQLKDLIEEGEKVFGG